MILIADGGSTKVDWRLLDKGAEVKKIVTNGANPYFRDASDIAEELKEKLLPEVNPGKIASVHFFGAGCEFEESNEVLRKGIFDALKVKEIEVGSDMLCAAKSLFGKDTGIACILGTGSNTCFYNGEKITENLASLGYVLGDEGSGAVLGRLLVGAIMRGQMTKGLKEKFEKQFDVSHASILDSVYKKPLPNKFLAGLSPFLLQNIEDESVYRLVHKAFDDFFVYNVMMYDYKGAVVSMTGSIAYYYQDVIRKIAEEHDIKIGCICRSPMEGLKKYYSEN